MNTIEMPKIEPIQYPSKKCSYFKKVVRWLTYTREWRIIENWYFILPENHTKIMIPKGFEMDGASIPRPFRNLLSPTGMLFLAGILHDYGYRYNKLIGVDTDGELFDYMPDAGKVFWDNLFMNVANQTSGLRVVNMCAYTALSLFGFIAWNQHRGRLPKLELID